MDLRGAEDAVTVDSQSAALAQVPRSTPSVDPSARSDASSRGGTGGEEEAAADGEEGSGERNMAA